ncbi:MAG: hypothetical protein AAF821_10755 [Cyanobacteria bacterium P01_D01_bin.156]
MDNHSPKEKSALDQGPILKSFDFAFISHLEVLENALHAPSYQSP